MIVKGTFEVTMHAEPPFDDVDGVKLSRASFDKRFSGPLEGTSKVQMLAALTPVETSRAYVAVERISATLEGRKGTFVVTHLGAEVEGKPSLTISILPHSGTGELAGISGKMQIQIVEGQHHYTLDYAFS
jgi:hypothetical protein